MVPVLKAKTFFGSYLETSSLPGYLKFLCKYMPLFCVLHGCTHPAKSCLGAQRTLCEHSLWWWVGNVSSSVHAPFPTFPSSITPPPPVLICEDFSYCWFCALTRRKSQIVYVQPYSSIFPPNHERLHFVSPMKCESDHFILLAVSCHV